MGEPELSQLTALLERLGAGPAQARTMAMQLLKRADQIAARKGIPAAEALNELLRLVVAGRSGEAPPSPGWDGVKSDTGEDILE